MLRGKRYTGDRRIGLVRYEVGGTQEQHIILLW